MIVEGFEGEAKMRLEQINRIIASIPDHARFLELGTYDGVTAAIIADARPDADIVSVDFHLGQGTAHLQNWYTNRRPNQAAFVGYTSAFAALRPGRLFDVVLVDADHSSEGAFADLCFAAAMVADHGPIWAHDYNLDGPGKAVDKFCEQGWGLNEDISDGCLVALERGRHE